MSSVNGNDTALIWHPTLYRRLSSTPVLAPGTQDNTSDSFEPVRSSRELQQARLTDALHRIEHPSLLRRLGDNAHWSAKKVFQTASDKTLDQYDAESYKWAWRELRGFPQQGWCRSFVFDASPSQRAEAYKNTHGLAIAPTGVEKHEAMGTFWSIRAVVLVRGMIHQLFGQVTEAEAIELVLDGLERLKEDSVERRFVAPILRADHMLGGENGNNYEVDALPIRATVRDLRACFEHLAAHLEDDTTRRRIFSVPTSAYFPKLGSVEAETNVQKKTTESNNSSLPQRFGVSSLTSIFTAVGAMLAAVVGAVVGLFSSRNAYVPVSQSDIELNERNEQGDVIDA